MGTWRTLKKMSLHVSDCEVQHRIGIRFSGPLLWIDWKVSETEATHSVRCDLETEAQAPQETPLAPSHPEESRTKTRQAKFCFLSG